MEDIELEDQGDGVIRMPDLNYEPNPKGIGCECYLMMKRNKNKIAQIDVSSGRRETFGTLLKRCVRTALEMKARGIRPEDVISLCTHNHMDSCVPYLAAFLVGAPVAALDPTLSFNDAVLLLSQVKPKMVFASSGSAKNMEDALDEAGIDAELVVFGGETTKHVPFEDFLRPDDVGEENFLPFAAENVFDTAAIFFSSGTTGLPKGICLNHYALLSQAENFTLLGFNSEVALAFSSLYWISAVLFLFQSVLSGTARIIAPKFDPRKAWHYIDKYKATVMFLAPSQAIAMTKLGRPEDISTVSLLDVVVGGGPTSQENLLAFRDLLPGTNVFQGYGQTEIAGVATVFKPNLRKDVMLLHEKPGSCGRPIVGMWYKIVDLETEENLGPHQHGEIRIKSKFVMNGYHEQDSSDVWDSDGWLKTGDVGYYDEDHCFYIVDRIKEMLKFQSWHVPPAQIEGVLLEHSAVRTAVVIGIPHDEDGDLPFGLVVLSDVANGVTPEELEKYVAERVDDRKKLRGGVRFIKTEDIPYTPTGKIKRKVLRDKIISGVL